MFLQCSEEAREKQSQGNREGAGEDIVESACTSHQYEALVSVKDVGHSVDRAQGFGHPSADVLENVTVGCCCTNKRLLLSGYRQK